MLSRSQEHAHQIHQNAGEQSGSCTPRGYHPQLAGDAEYTWQVAQNTPTPSYSDSSFSPACQPPRAPGLARLQLRLQEQEDALCHPAPEQPPAGERGHSAWGYPHAARRKWTASGSQLLPAPPVGALKPPYPLACPQEQPWCPQWRPQLPAAQIKVQNWPLCCRQPLTLQGACRMPAVCSHNWFKPARSYSAGCLQCAATKGSNRLEATLQDACSVHPDVARLP